MAKVNLQPNEVVLIKCEDICYSGFWSSYTDDLILTNQCVMHVSKGTFGNIKNIRRFPLSQIKQYNGKPQVSLKNPSSSTPIVVIDLLTGEEEFTFPENQKENALRWINELYKLMTGKESDISITKKSVIPGAEALAKTLKGTVDTFANTFGVKTKDKDVSISITKKCRGCSAPLTGVKGATVRCKYCDTEQVL